MGGRRPVIGVTGFHEQWAFEHGSYLFTATERVFTDGLLEAGGLPVLLMSAAETTDDAVAMLDGLLLTGGADVEPSHYGREVAPETGTPDHERDAFEIALVRAAVDRGLPVLAVCRGNQVVNVALGGELVQHAPTHQGYGHPTVGFHDVDVAAGSRLASVLGAGNHPVNSLHHQTVGSTAPSLRAVAHTADGSVEATEHPDQPLITVQWHPERQLDNDYWSRLASWLVREARTYSSRTPEGQEP
ncbi:gamma-glutamyl-gamma-aminobutyrate hydrolase family protein [Longivirga aurantiaca]|uniref:Gamma-glutamyl-gamma-aminobutyrate hydrolase family protein n=1 Tax=Longivirga aurantiaca TaxID=1837743 RepID=A0ABW1SVI2_9ACTN